MHQILFPAAVLLVVAPFALGSVTPALAQVTVDLKALEAMPPAPAPPPSSTPAQRKPNPTKPAIAKKPPAKPVDGARIAHPAPPQPPPRTPPPLPTTPPAAANLTALPTPTPQPGPPLIPPPVSASAKGNAVPFAGGLRVTFGDGAGELSPTSEAALKDFLQTVPQSEALTFNVQAYSAGKADDPSTARRLSLSRGLAVRSVLMNAGVPSSRIYIRALGTAFGTGPADRADVTALGANAGSPAP